MVLTPFLVHYIVDKDMTIKLSLGDTQLIINEAKKEGLLRNQLAYVLATAYHETAHTMKPVREYGGDTYLRKKKYWPYVGMGYVQVTWDYNYRMVGEKLGVDFLSDPKKLLDSQYAVPVAVRGMKEGWFGNKKTLADYMTLKSSDFFNARSMINGDKNIFVKNTKIKIGDLIAGYAKEYNKLLLDTGYGVEVLVEGPKKPVEAIPEVQAPVQRVEAKPSPWASMGDVIGIIIQAIFGGINGRR